MRQSDKDKFLIIKNIKNFIISLESLLVVFPKKDIFTRNTIYEDSLELLELVNRANYENRKDYKMTLQIHALAKLNKIDFYLERAYRFRYISEKQCLKATKELADISNMIYAWCNNEK